MKKRESPDFRSPVVGISEFIVFLKQPFYGNYSTLHSHTNTVNSHAFAQVYFIYLHLHLHVLGR